jgi:hypothetical protein
MPIPPLRKLRGQPIQREPGVGPVVPLIGLVVSVAAMLGASLERLKLRVQALEQASRVMVNVKRGAAGTSDG